jgi:hypothetical protein
LIAKLLNWAICLLLFVGGTRNLSYEAYYCVVADTSQHLSEPLLLGCTTTA